MSGTSLPVGAGTPAAPASWFQMTIALAAYELRLVVRRGEGLLVTFVIPAGVLLVFSVFDTSGGTATAPPVDRLLPGSIALAIIATSMVSLAISTGYERSYGVIKRLGGSPAGSSVVIAAKAAAVVVVELGQLVLLIGVAAGVLGWTAGPGASVPLVLVALVLGTLAFASLGLLMASTFRAEATLALANLLFLVALVLGGIVLPLDRLPSPVEAVAHVLPAAALTASMGVGLSGVGNATGPMLVLAAWAVVLTVLAARRFRWD